MFISHAEASSSAHNKAVFKDAWLREERHKSSSLVPSVCSSVAGLWLLPTQHKSNGQMPRPQSVASEGASDQMVPWPKNLPRWPSASGSLLSANGKTWGGWGWGAALSLAVHRAFSATSGKWNWPVVRAGWSFKSVTELVLGYHFFP